MRIPMHMTHPKDGPAPRNLITRFFRGVFSPSPDIPRIGFTSTPCTPGFHLPPLQGKPGWGVIHEAYVGYESNQRSYISDDCWRIGRSNPGLPWFPSSSLGTQYRKLCFPPPTGPADLRPTRYTRPNTRTRGERIWKQSFQKRVPKLELGNQRHRGYAQPCCVKLHIG